MHRREWLWGSVAGLPLAQALTQGALGQDIVADVDVRPREQPDPCAACVTHLQLPVTGQGLLDGESPLLRVQITTVSLQSAGSATLPRSAR